MAELGSRCAARRPRVHARTRANGRGDRRAISESPFPSQTPVTFKFSESPESSFPDTEGGDRPDRLAGAGLDRLAVSESDSDGPTAVLSEGVREREIAWVSG